MGFRHHGSGGGIRGVAGKPYRSDRDAATFSGPTAVQEARSPPAPRPGPPGRSRTLAATIALNLAQEERGGNLALERALSHRLHRGRRPAGARRAAPERPPRRPGHLPRSTRLCPRPPRGTRSRTYQAPPPPAARGDVPQFDLACGRRPGAGELGPRARLRRCPCVGRSSPFGRPRCALLQRDPSERWGPGTTKTRGRHPTWPPSRRSCWRRARRRPVRPAASRPARAGKKPSLPRCRGGFFRRPPPTPAQPGRGALQEGPGVRRPTASAAARARTGLFFFW